MYRLWSKCVPMNLKWTQGYDILNWIDSQLYTP